MNICTAFPKTGIEKFIAATIELDGITAGIFEGDAAECYPVTTDIDLCGAAQGDVIAAINDDRMIWRAGLIDC